MYRYSEQNLIEEPTKQLFVELGYEVMDCRDELMLENFPDVAYQDVAGLCKVATLDEIREQGYSLNPGRYVGVALEAEDDFDFNEKLTELNDELQELNVEARELEEKIGVNIKAILEG
ncbi:MAG: N-6 DNA methylase [Dehalococcoidales bacterium]|nr:N-6 DNA methylase [Dehalococcoidales bacterium]|tara:strand:- start:259 stop:612 length:354 start_codon:yes stop_codon:yes gene_type:complete